MWEFLVGIGGGVVGQLLVLLLIILAELAWGPSREGQEPENS